MSQIQDILKCARVTCGTNLSSCNKCDLSCNHELLDGVFGRAAAPNVHWNQEYIAHATQGDHGLHHSNINLDCIKNSYCVTRNQRASRPIVLNYVAGSDVRM